MPPCLRDPKWKFGLTHLLHLALLSRFTLMSQFHPGEINFERQPGQIRAVCDSEQEEYRFNLYARRYLDVYALLLPYRVIIDPYK